MIEELQMSNVASFKTLASLRTDKKINLVYGLNGTGKTTVSDFLYTPTDPRFENCKLSPEIKDGVFVYNQSFIREHFYEADNLRGIFSLSKENKEAEQKIANAQKRIEDLKQTLKEKQEELTKVEGDFSKKKQLAIDEIWKIKTNFCGGDRVLEYCLEGLKGEKGKLFSHIQNIAKPNEEPNLKISQIKKDVEILKDTSSQSAEKLPNLIFPQHDVESHSIFQKTVIGNKESIVSDLINNLNNSDWVKEGLKYMPVHIDEHSGLCPFCQQQTITPELSDQIARYFDETYETDVSTIKRFAELYESAIKGMPGISEYINNGFVADDKIEFEKLYNDCIQLLEGNLRKINEKLQNPSAQKMLKNSKPAFDKFNVAVNRVNEKIGKHNAKIANRQASLDSLKDQFWELMRWNYDQTISRFLLDREETKLKGKELEECIAKIDIDIEKHTTKIAEAQRDTVNIDQAIGNINTGLIDLGIEDFKIQKHTDSLYRIIRSDESDDAFRTLSEGEKMIISFLYFCELCKGKRSADDAILERIAVIDDPISSLSHIYIFNVGQLIQRLFFRSDIFKQVFVLTHSLYFFYELTDANHERRDKTQQLFRMVKNSKGSQIHPMKYEEIQNDYQTYWNIVKDSDQPPALLANCMRNIIEYFFNFVKQKDLNNVFQMPELQDTKFQAFCRYINRESHSSGQNIFDLKEFDYDVFRDGLSLVFEKTGFSDHYKQMIKD